MTTPRSHPRRKLAAGVACLALLVSITAGCSDGDEDAATTTTVDPRQEYCDAWADVIATFEAFDEIDIVNEGLDSVRDYFDDLEGAVSALETAAGEQLGSEVEAFTGALDDLSNALDSSTPTEDRGTQVREAADAVDTTWNDLVEAFTADCPSVTASTVVAGAG